MSMQSNEPGRNRATPNRLAEQQLDAVAAAGDLVIERKAEAVSAPAERALNFTGGIRIQGLR